MFFVVISNSSVRIPWISFFVNNFFQIVWYNFYNSFSNWNAEGGIRTHVPFRTNGFQDRLVMTTSIPLQFASLSTALIDYHTISMFVNTVFEFFKYLFSNFTSFFPVNIVFIVLMPSRFQGLWKLRQVT